MTNFPPHKYRLLVDNLPEAFAYHQLIPNSDGNPADYIFLDVNAPFTEMTGLSRNSVIGRKVSEVLPDLKSSGFDWIGTYGKVALTGESIRFEKFSEPLDRWYEVTAYSDQPGYFATLFRDITAQKKEKTSLQQLNRLVEETVQTQLAFETMIADISTAFVTLPADMINQGINYALRLTGDFFNVDRSYIFQFSPDGNEASNTHEWCKEGIEPQLHNLQKVPVSSFPWWLEKLILSEAIVIPRVAEMPPEAASEKAILQAQAIQSVLVVHVRYANKLLGFLGFDAVREDKNWEEKHVTLLKLVSEIIAGALAGKQWKEELEQKSKELQQLYHQLDEEVDKARQLHERTLPRTVPAVEDISLAAHYQTARRLGGDFYNMLRAGDKLVLYLSDVSGHGLEGTILSTFIKEAIDSYVSLEPDRIDPQSILRHLDRQYRRGDYPADYFICVFLAVLDLNTMELSYTSTGFQEPPLVRTGNGERVRLISEGPPISNAIPEKLMDFSEGRIGFTPGTTVLFTTDGLTEQTVGGEPYMDRLEDVFYAHSHLPADVLLQVINDDFCRFNQGSLQGDDDITFGIAQREPENKIEYKLELKSSLKEMSELLREVAPVVEGMDGYDWFLNGLYELVANAIEHGNNSDPEKIVTVKIIATDDYLYAQVKDQGEGFNWREKIDKPIELNGNQQRGRGIAMTRISCKHLYYNEKGNRATLLVDSSLCEVR